MLTEWLTVKHFHFWGDYLNFNGKASSQTPLLIQNTNLRKKLVKANSYHFVMSILPSRCWDKPYRCRFAKRMKGVLWVSLGWSLARRSAKFSVLVLVCRRSVKFWYCDSSSSSCCMKNWNIVRELDWSTESFTRSFWQLVKSLFHQANWE